MAVQFIVISRTIDAKSKFLVQSIVTSRTMNAIGKL